MHISGGKAPDDITQQRTLFSTIYEKGHSNVHASQNNIAGRIHEQSHETWATRR